MPPRRSKATGAGKPSRAKASQPQAQSIPVASLDPSMPTPRRRRVGKGPENGIPCTTSALEAQPLPVQPLASPLRVMASPLRAAALQPAHEDDDRTPRASECGDLWVTAPTSPGGTTQCYDDTASERTATYDDGSAGEASQTFASPSPERAPAPRGRQQVRASPSPEVGRPLQTTPQRSRKSRGRWRVLSQAEQPKEGQSPAPMPTPVQARSCRTTGRRRRFSNSAVPPLPPPPNTGTVYNMTGQTPKARTRRLSGLTVRTFLKRRSLAATTPPAQETSVVGDYDAACRALWTGTQPPAAGAAAPHSVPSLKELLAAKAEEPPAVEEEVDMDVDTEAARPVGAGDDSFDAASPYAGQPSTEAGVTWARPKATRAAAGGTAVASAVAPTDELHRQSRVATTSRPGPTPRGCANAAPWSDQAEATKARGRHHPAASSAESPPTPAWLRMCERPGEAETATFAPVATRAAASKGGGSLARHALEVAPSALAFSQDTRRQRTSKSCMPQQGTGLDESDGEGRVQHTREARTSSRPLAWEAEISAPAFSQDARRQRTSSRVPQQGARLDESEEAEGRVQHTREMRTSSKPLAWAAATAELAPNLRPSTVGVQKGTIAHSVAPAAAKQRACSQVQEAATGNVEAANLPTPCRRSSQTLRSVEAHAEAPSASSTRGSVSSMRGRRAEPAQAAAEEEWLHRLPSPASASDSEEEPNLSWSGAPATQPFAARRPSTQSADPPRAAVVGAAITSASRGGQRGTRAQVAGPSAGQTDSGSAAGRRRISRKRPDVAVSASQPQAQAQAQGSTPLKAVPRRISSKSAQAIPVAQSPAARGGQATVAPARATQGVAVLTATCADSDSDEASPEPEVPNRSTATAARARSAGPSQGGQRAAPVQRAVARATIERDDTAWATSQRPRGAVTPQGSSSQGPRLEESGGGSLGRTEMLAFQAAFQEEEAEDIQGSAALAAARVRRGGGGQVSDVAGQSQGRTAASRPQAACSVLQPASEEEEEEDESPAPAPAASSRRALLREGGAGARRPSMVSGQAVSATRAQEPTAQPRTSLLGAQPRSRTPSAAPAGANKAWVEQQQGLCSSGYEVEEVGEALQGKAVTGTRGQARGGFTHTSALGAQPRSGAPAAAQTGSTKARDGQQLQQQGMCGLEADDTFEAAEAHKMSNTGARRSLGLSKSRGQHAAGSAAARLVSAPAAMVLNEQSNSEDEEEVEEAAPPPPAAAARARRVSVQESEQQCPPPVQSARAFSACAVPVVAARAGAQKRGTGHPGQDPTAAATLASASESEEELPSGAQAVPAEKGGQACKAKRQRVGGRIVGSAQNAGVLMPEEDEPEPTFVGRSSYSRGSGVQSPVQMQQQPFSVQAHQHSAPQQQQQQEQEQQQQQPQKQRRRAAKAQEQKNEGPKQPAADLSAMAAVSPLPQQAGICHPKRQRAGPAEEEPSPKRHRLAGKTRKQDVGLEEETAAPPPTVDASKGRGRGAGRGRGSRAAKAKPATAGAAMHFVTTGLHLSETQQHTVQALNAKVAEVWSPQATHLVADTFRRTNKLMCAICSGAPIVTPEYISACGAAGERVDEGPYLLRDEVCEAGFARRRNLKSGFSVVSSVERARRHGPLLKGMSVYCFPSVSDKRDLPQLVAVAGGTWLKDIPSKIDSTVLLLAERSASSEEERQHRKTREVYDVEFLYEAACTQEFRRSYYKLS